MDGWLAWLGWQALWSSLVALPVALADRALGRRLPGLRWSLWNLVLLRLVVPVDLSAPWGPGRVMARLLAELGDRPLPAPAEAAASLALLPGGLSAADAAPPVTGPGGWILAAGLAWALGAGLSAAAWLRGRRRHRALASSAEPAREAWLDGCATAWRERLGVGRAVAVAVSDEAAQPFTLGILRPVICLPRSLLLRSRREVSAVLGHEMAHVRRLDDLALRLEAVLGALFWFHPVVWWARRRLEAIRESLCDEAALSAGELSRAGYARTLLALAAAAPGSPGRRSFGGLGVISGWAAPRGRRSLAERVRGVLEARPGGARRRWVALGAVAGLVLLPLAPAAGGGATAERPAAAVEHASAAWIHPAPGSRITSPFGPRQDPFTGAASHHDGVDLAGSRGTPVHAVAAGVVRTATRHYQPAPHHGTVVVLDHPGGEVSFYSHLDALAVAEGERVAAGQLLGGMGTTGEVTGPHLHFELWRSGDPVDPLAALTPSRTAASPR